MHLEKKVSTVGENAKQPYVLATLTVPFTIDEESDHMTSTTRAVEVLFFGRQLLTPSQTESPITCYFASVRWPKCCHSQDIGKPAQVWYFDIDFHSENALIIPQSIAIVSRLVTICDTIQLENVLITVPLVE